MPAHESYICIIGAGISAAMLAQKLSELRPGVSIAIVEAGDTSSIPKIASSIANG